MTGQSQTLKHERGKHPDPDSGNRPALLIVAHGERGGSRDDALVHELVNRQDSTGRYRSVKCCFISKEPKLAPVFAELSPGPVIIYPLFMSNGYFVKTSIPKALKQAAGDQPANLKPAEIRPPFGLTSRLPGLMVSLAEGAARAAGLDASSSQLLVVAHGSGSDSASRDAAQDVVDAMAPVNPFAAIHLCFLEEPPFVADTLAGIPGPVVVIGLFIGQGMHAADDVPEAVAESGRTDVVLVPPISAEPRFFDLVCHDMDRN